MYVQCEWTEQNYRGKFPPFFSRNFTAKFSPDFTYTILPRVYEVVEYLITGNNCVKLAAFLALLASLPYQWKLQLLTLALAGLFFFFSSHRSAWTFHDLLVFSNDANFLLECQSKNTNYFNRTRLVSIAQKSGESVTIYERTILGSFASSVAFFGVKNNQAIHQCTFSKIKQKGLKGLNKVQPK